MKVLRNALSTSCALLLCLGLLLNFSSRFSWLREHGFSFYMMTSGSMSSLIPSGSLLYAPKPNVATLVVGDIITFQTTPNIFVTHRITKVIKQSETTQSSTYEFVTKGD